MSTTNDGHGGGRDESESGDETRATRSVEPSEVRTVGAGSEGEGDELLELAAENGRLGRYIVLSRLGAGGMGVVLEAFDRTLDRRIALKVLHRGLDRRNTQWLLREAQALAKLSHPNVVQVYEAGEAEQRAFIAMELVPGQTLQAWLEQSPRPSWDECVRVYLQAGEGLAAAHSRGLVHRDFKPSNAVIDEEGRVRVLDFGLAREVAERSDESTPDDDEVSVDSMLEAGLTKTGAVVGTPAYMPPEQMSGEDVDARSDQFGFCIALYEALYGERPFEGSSMAALMLAMTHEGVRPAPKGSPVPPRLRAALLRGLSIEPDQRWPSMEALLEQLRLVVAPRRSRWLAAGLAGSAIAMLIAVRLGMGLGEERAETQELCTGAASQLDGVWDDAIEERVQQQFLGLKLSYGPTTWERVQAQLDAYAEAWTEKHTEVCRAARVTQEQTEDEMSLRMECLRDRKVHLGATVRVLGEADEQVVREAVATVRGLPGLARCDDLDALRSENPPPEDPEVAQEVEALSEQLAEVQAKRLAGKYVEGLEQVGPIETRAKALGYMPLVAEATFFRGELVGKAEGEFEEQARIANEAYLLALEHGLDGLALSTSRSLSHCIGFQLHRGDEGLQWAKTALALAKRSGDEHELGRTINAMGSVLTANEELDEALKTYDEARVVLQRAVGDEHPDVAITLNNLALVYLRKQDPDRAQGYHEQALEIETKALGPDHPEVAASLTNLGNVFWRQKRYEQAIELHEQALEIQEKAVGPEHPVVAGMLNNLALAQMELGEYEQARDSHQRALTIRQRVLGPEHPLVASSATNLGIAFEYLGRYQLAERVHHRALQIRKETLGYEHPQVARSFENLGIVLDQRGKDGAATRAFESALEIREKTLGADHLGVAHSLSLLGDMLLRQGMFEDARRHHERALAIRNAKLGPEDPGRAVSIIGLAEVALAQGQIDVALAHAKEAVALQDAAMVDVRPHELAAGRFVLARCLWPDPTQRPRARELAEQARAGFVVRGVDTRRDLAEVVEWIAGLDAQ
ncbi:MAG: serine/threonine-protein kinase [Myxococcota bacterium]